MPGIDAAFLKKLLTTFRLEAEEHISAISSGLVELEGVTTSGRRAELIECIFREAHSLKGAARSVNQKKIETICQSLETIFSGIKDGRTAPSAELFDRLHSMTASITSELAETDQGPIRPAVQPSLGPPPPDLESNGSSEGLASLSLALTTDVSQQRPTEYAGSMDTVRVASAKLGRLLLDAEELNLSRKSLSRFSGELAQTQAVIGAWEREWKRVRSKSRTAVRVSSNGTSGCDEALSNPVHLMALLDRNQQDVQLIRRQIAATMKSFEREQRALGRRASDLLDQIKRLTMIPFSSLLEIFPKLVRDLSRDFGKEADLVVRGANVEAERRILEDLKDPLIHLIRNCIDHGIETPVERQKVGKPRRATLGITITPRSGNRVEIVVSDDGSGIDLDKLRTAAERQGILTHEDAQKLDDRQSAMLIFHSGLSTRQMITEVSGRGLGMAIVRDKVVSLGGEVAVETQRGTGTLFRLTLGLTMARFRGVIVQFDNQRFAVPTMHVVRAMRVEQGSIRSIENRPAVELDGRTISVVWLAQILGAGVPETDTPPTRKWPSLLLEWAGERILVLVDEVLLDQEVLVKNLGKQLIRVRNIFGAAILQTGEIVPVLNVADLMRSAATLSSSAPARRVEKNARSILVAEDSFTSRTLLKQILESSGYTVTTAVDGREAFQLLENQTFDLVVSDVEMPHMDGFELTSKIRAHRRLGETPVVLVTALDSREHRERGADVGANAYIVKSSFEQSNLLEIIQRLI